MIKIKEAFKLPAVLSISILLMLSQTAGSFFSKSLSLLSFSGLILAVSCSTLILIANQNINIYDKEGFKRSQLYSMAINCLMLFIIAAYIIYRAAVLLSEPHNINAALASWVIFAAFIGLILCLIILYPEIKKNKTIKLLFFKYLFCAFLTLVILAVLVIYYLKDMYFLDSIVSICIAAFIILQSFSLIKQALLVLVK